MPGTLQVIPIPGKAESCNCYLVLDTADRHAILIDTGCDSRIVGIIRRLGLAPESIRMVINTHCHFDHTVCNEYFTEAKVCMHTADARQVEEMNDSVTLAALAKMEILPKVDRHLKDGDVIEMRSGTLTIIHTPGHTAGSISILSSTGILFSGDTVFADAVGRTDIPTGNREALQKSLQLLSIKKFLHLYPGHGPPTTKDRIQKVLEDGILDRMTRIP